MSYINTTDALSMCCKRGLSVTASGLLYAGRQRGFVRKSEDGFHWEYEIGGLSLYINDAVNNNNIPKGWIPISEAPAIVGKCLATIYNYINSGLLKAVQYGRDHIYHIEKKELINVFKQSDKENNNEK